jgi:predicted DNA-binding protein YlxM (UPF0122 family)
MNRQQVNTLLEILAGLQIGDNTVEQPLRISMKEFYATLLANREGKHVNTIQQEFDKKVDLLRWKLGQAFRYSHQKELAKTNEKQTKSSLTIEKDYSIAEVAKMFKMTPQNLNKHLEKHSEIKVKTLSPRKRFIVESELKKVMQVLGKAQE